MNSKQLIITTVAATLMTFSFTVAAECDGDDPMVKTVYLKQASNDHHVVRVNDNNQGKHNRGNNNNRQDKDQANDGSAWYKPWSWRSNSPDSDDDDHRDNQNSNRQSDPDSTRGQARAEERRGDKDNARKKNDAPWYDPRGWFE